MSVQSARHRNGTAIGNGVDQLDRAPNFVGRSIVRLIALEPLGYDCCEAIGSSRSGARRILALADQRASSAPRVTRLRQRHRGGAAQRHTMQLAVEAIEVDPRR